MTVFHDFWLIGDKVKKKLLAINFLCAGWSVGYKENNTEFETVVENNHCTHNPIKWAYLEKIDLRDIGKRFFVLLSNGVTLHAETFANICFDTRHHLVE